MYGYYFLSADNIHSQPFSGFYIPWSKHTDNWPKQGGEKGYTIRGEGNSKMEIIHWGHSFHLPESIEFS